MRFARMLLIVLVVAFVVTGCQGKRGAKTATGLNRVHFDFDRSSIKPDMVKTMDANASYIKAHKKLNVTVEGHCDERGTNEYNLALGDRRAQAAKTYLENKGVNQNRLKSVSYGEEKPLQKGSNESSWYMNRRAEFVRK